MILLLKFFYLSVAAMVADTHLSEYCVDTGLP